MLSVVFVCAVVCVFCDPLPPMLLMIMPEKPDLWEFASLFDPLFMFKAFAVEAYPLELLPVRIVRCWALN